MLSEFYQITCGNYFIFGRKVIAKWSYKSDRSFNKVDAYTYYFTFGYIGYKTEIKREKL